MTNLIFCDFDGTISRKDVGYNIFHHFSNGKNDALLPDWKSGAMTTRECLRREAEMVNASKDEIYDFIGKFELNDGFVEFVSLCRDSKLPMTILSDGLDFYIKFLLGRENLGQIPVLSNIGRLENRTIQIEFPHKNRVCKSCGSCKAERIAEFRAAVPGETMAIFIGDGYSDACATREADLIYAKKDLEVYCREKKIDYRPFDTFFDVISDLTDKGIISQ